MRSNPPLPQSPPGAKNDIALVCKGLLDFKLKLHLVNNNSNLGCQSLAFAREKASALSERQCVVYIPRILLRSPGSPGSSLDTNSSALLCMWGPNVSAAINKLRLKGHVTRPTKRYASDRIPPQGDETAFTGCSLSALLLVILSLYSWSSRV